jgi:hypothetical protein
MKLKTLLLILLIFFVLRSINSPYIPTTGTWLIIGGPSSIPSYSNNLTGSLATYYKSNNIVQIKPITFPMKMALLADSQNGPYFDEMRSFRSFLTIRNMFILCGIGLTTIITVNLTTQALVRSPGPILNLPTTTTYGGNQWVIAMGDMLISSSGYYTTYIPTTNSWTAISQTPIISETLDNFNIGFWWWKSMNNNMLISARGVVTTYTPGPNGTYGTWSTPQQGPEIFFDSKNAKDIIACVFGNMVIGQNGYASTYNPTNKTWTPYVQTLPLLTNDRWSFVLDDMIISSKNKVCKKINGIFTIVTTPLFPTINGQWRAAMQLN